MTVSFCLALQAVAVSFR